MNKPQEERRKRIRVEIPLSIALISKKNVIHSAKTKDISPHGLRFETDAEDIAVNDEIELKIDIPEARNPVHAKEKIVWKKKLSEDVDASQDVGCELTEIEEDNKNTLLEYFLRLSGQKEKGE